jgi:hypothetical protein
LQTRWLGKGVIKNFFGNLWSEEQVTEKFSWRSGEAVMERLFWRPDGEENE